VLAVIHLAGGAGVHLAAPPQHRADARGELAKAERLRHVVIGPQIEARHPIAFPGARREHDDGHRGRGRARLENATDLNPAEDGEVEIENNQVGGLFADRAKGGVAARDDLDAGVSRSFERVFDETGDILLVLDDEHARQLVRRPAGCRPRMR
jgi:hypothetical protein